jgi:hypothetical protein
MVGGAPRDRTAKNFQNSTLSTSFYSKATYFAAVADSRRNVLDVKLRRIVRNLCIAAKLLHDDDFSFVAKDQVKRQPAARGANFNISDWWTHRNDIHVLQVPDRV